LDYRKPRNLVRDKSFGLYIFLSEWLKYIIVFLILECISELYNLIV